MRESSQRSANLQLHLGPRKNEGIAEVLEASIRAQIHNEVIYAKQLL